MIKINKKFIGYVSVVLLLFIIMLNVWVSYYLLANRETQNPAIQQDTCTIKVEKFQNRKIFIITPKETQNINKAIFYFHGGAYVQEATNMHWEFIQKLAVDANAIIYMPDYPLTPQYTYKDVYNMVEPFYEEYVTNINKRNSNIKNVIVMGDSAGGGLALGLMEKLSNSNKESILPNKIILISPWLDVRLNNPEIDSVQKDDIVLSKTGLQIVGEHYSGNDGINSYLVNPIEGDMSKLSNITIMTGKKDILNPDVHRLAEIAKKQGILINIKEYENAYHVWFIEHNGSQAEIDAGYEELLKICLEY